MKFWLTFLMMYGFMIQFLFAQEMQIEWAKIQGPDLVQVQVSGKISPKIKNRIKIDPYLDIQSVNIKQEFLEIRTQSPLRLDQHYYLKLQGHKKRFLQPDGVLDSLYSDKPLGCQVENNGYAFRVFAPRAKWVHLALFERHDDNRSTEFPMRRDENGVWEFFTEENWAGKYYGYRVWGPSGEGEMFDSTIVVADPYSRAVVTKNHYTHPAKTLIMEPDRFDWEGDTWQNIPHRDLIIYEMHVRDMTAHPSSGVPERVRGTYVGLIHEPQEGGLPYIGELDVNAVELLPAQDFGNIEPPFRDSTISVFNTWNPYSQNHWGYMTSYFFAPESYYATGSTLEPGQYNGEDGRQIREFKEMVKAFHQNNIAVLMDVVYNHVSQYDYNPLKYIDKFYYFRLTPNCDFENISGCGNDFKTERPMARRLIVESVKFWMEEYHIDGFRFDLANLIDWKTCTEILKEARKINPKVIIIAEPWGGGYNPPGFSDIGWAAWNDQIRNGYKGWNPHEDRGFVFGDWQNRNTRKSLQRYAMGSPRKFGGQYRDISHCVNYLASHDDHTLGDFIRLALREVEENQRITNLEANVRLSPQELKANKLAALALLTSQGMVMIHEGQEFARSKVIAKTAFPDSAWGHIDHNSYEKDNPTNWLNFRHVEINEELRQYYHNLIQLRKTYAAFRRADPGDFNFRQTADSLFLVYSLRYSDQHFQVALNGNPGKDHELALPIGKWEILADGKGVYDEKPGEVEDSRIMVPATSGVILKRIE